MQVACGGGMSLAAAACVGIGSSIYHPEIYHPEATHVTRAASGGRRGLGQGTFQFGGRAGSALGPLLAALLAAQRGQSAIAWFALLAIVAMALAVWVARRQIAAATVGAILGGIAGDRIERYQIIWISVLGPLPSAPLLPHANLFWTGALTVLINLVMASAFASILLYAMDLLPYRIGLGGIAAAALGAMADSIGIEAVYRISSFLPLAGLLAWFLPRIDDRPAPQATAAGAPARN